MVMQFFIRQSIPRAVSQDKSQDDKWRRDVTWAARPFFCSFSECSRSIDGHLFCAKAIYILTCMLFGAISGSSVAAVSSVGGFMIPIMNKEGYHNDFNASVNFMFFLS